MQNSENFPGEKILQKIKHFLMSNLGKVEKEATNQEFYHALCIALREEIMINWSATLHTFDHKAVRSVNYFSMEYLPGKMLGNTLTNTKVMPFVKSVLERTNRSLHEIIKCDPDLGLGNGGLGRLASCFLDSLATQHYPAFGYGLRYQYGIFEQEIWNGEQVERPDCWLLNHYPLEFRKDIHSQSILYGGKPIRAQNRHGDEVFLLEDYEEIRALAYDIPIVGFSEEIDFSVLTLRLWSTKESPRNFALQRYNAGQLGEAGENTSLTDVLYPNDNHEMGKKIRLKQEFLLVSASLQDIIHRHLRVHGDIFSFADKVQIQINDTHPALVIAELTRRLIKNHDVPWDKAWEITQNCCNFTNHTILKESLEEWNEHRVEELLPRQYKIIQKLNGKFCSEIRQKFNNDEEKLKKMSFIENGQIKMANLAIFGCKKINGVAKLHGEILKNILFKDFNDFFPDKFTFITNGVTPRRWLVHSNPELAKFITDRIGASWITHFSEIKKLAEFAKDEKSQKDFLQIKRENKKRLFDFLSKENPIRDHKGKIVSHSQVLSPDALVDVQIKRIHEYKRQLLLIIHTIMLYFEILDNPDARKVKRQIIMGGKAAPGYRMAKNVIKLFYCVMKKINEDPSVSEHLKLAYVENYNVSKAELLIPATDLSEQISTAGMEASGTGNMKLAMNGALTIGTRDGANIEMREEVTDQWWPFSFGCSAEEIATIKKEKNYNPQQICIDNPALQRALHALKDGTFVHTDTDHESLCEVYNALLNGADVTKADHYFVLKDLEDYYNTQKKVEDLYVQENLWAEYAIHNVASMSRFSSDAVIEHYAKEIWDLNTCPIDEEVAKEIKQAFAESQHFILPSEENK